MATLMGRLGFERYLVDGMLTTASIYWHFATMWSSVRYYKEEASAWGSAPERSPTPLAVAAMPHDLGAAGPDES